MSGSGKRLPLLAKEQHRYWVTRRRPDVRFRSPRAFVLLRLCGRHVFVTSTIDNERRLWGDLDRGTPILVVTDAGAAPAWLRSGTPITRR